MSSVGQDPFVAIKDATVDHQSRHGCECYPFDDGPQLTAWASRAKARTVVELGTSLGYSAASFAAAGAQVYTVDRDPSHAREARRHLDAHQIAERVHRMVGEAVDVLAALPEGEADLAFFDGMAPSLAEVGVLVRALRPGGLLIVSNMTLGGQATQVRDLLTTWDRQDLGLNLLAVKPEES